MFTAKVILTRRTVAVLPAESLAKALFQNGDPENELANENATRVAALRHYCALRCGGIRLIYIADSCPGLRAGRRCPVSVRKL